MFSFFFYVVWLFNASTGIFEQVTSGRISGLKLVPAPLGKAIFPLRRNYRLGSLQVCCAVSDNNFSLPWLWCWEFHAYLFLAFKFESSKFFPLSFVHTVFKTIIDLWHMNPWHEIMFLFVLAQSLYGYCPCFFDYNCWRLAPNDFHIHKKKKG